MEKVIRIVFQTKKNKQTGLEFIDGFAVLGKKGGKDKTVKVKLYSDVQRELLKTKFTLSEDSDFTAIEMTLDTTQHENYEEDQSYVKKGKSYIDKKTGILVEGPQELHIKWLSKDWHEVPVETKEHDSVDGLFSDIDAADAEF